MGFWSSEQDKDEDEAFKSLGPRQEAMNFRFLEKYKGNVEKALDAVLGTVWFNTDGTPKGTLAHSRVSKKVRNRKKETKTKRRKKMTEILALLKSEIMRFWWLIHFLPVFLWTWGAQDSDDFDGPGPREPERKTNPEKSEGEKLTGRIITPSELEKKERQDKEAEENTLRGKLEMMVTKLMNVSVKGRGLTSKGGAFGGLWEEYGLETCEIPVEKKLKEMLSSILGKSGWEVVKIDRGGSGINIEVKPLVGPSLK
jgi:hypothetical protein